MRRTWVCFCVLLVIYSIYSVRLILRDLRGHTTAAVGKKDMPAQKTRPWTCYGSVEELRYLIQQDQFQEVEKGNQSYVYTAYIDGRTTADVKSAWLPVLRVFAWFRRKDAVVRRWRCVFWDEDLVRPIEGLVVGWTDLNKFAYSRRVVSAMILCPLRGRKRTNMDESSGDNINNSSNSSSSSNDDDNNNSVVVTTPFAVSVVSSSCQRPRNLIRVVDLRQRSSARRRDAASSYAGVEYPANFSVCVPPIFGNFDAVPDLVEFVEVNRLLGAEKFHFYNNSIGRRADACLWEYVRRGVVDVQPWSLPSSVFDVVYYRGQILAINECLYRSMYRTKYLVIQDLDEFVVPMRSENWQTMLNSIAKSARTNSDRIASYSFRNRFFPTDLPKVFDFASGTGIERRFKTLLVTRADKQLFPFTVRSKMMARPERITIWHVHLILDTSLVRRGDRNVYVDAAYGQLFHYRRNVSVTNTTVVSRLKQFQPQILRRFNVATAAICLTGDYLFQ